MLYPSVLPCILFVNNDFFKLGISSKSLIIKISSLEKICSDEGMEPVIFNLSEYMKSGAMLSCMIMHLNRVDHFKTLL